MPFQKGQSGNPSGRPKTVLANGMSLRDMAREHTEDAIKALVTVMTTADSAQAVTGAAVALLDRGWGKPAQAVELTGAEGGPVQTLDVSKAPEEVLRWMAAQATGEPA